MLLVLFHLTLFVRRRLVADDRGQATAEYALVVLGAAALALAVSAWAVKSGAVADLLGDVFTSIRKRV